MVKGYIVSLCFDRNRCVLQTELVAKRHGALNFTVEIVHTTHYVPAYRGTVFFDEEIGDAIVCGK